MKFEKKYLQSKKFSDLKNEVNIFEGIEHIKAERIWAKVQNKNKKEETKDDYISSLKKMLSEDERTINQLHLFNKESFRSIVENMDDKIVFINAENKVDVLYYDVGSNEDVGAVSTASPLVDYIELDRKSSLYEGSILSLKAINLYKHYRSINSLEEIL